jgi:predicted DNA-binding protein
MRKVLSISLPQELLSELEDFAKVTERTKSDIVKESISLYLWEARYQEARKKLGDRGRKKSIRTDEEVFRIVS